jgi:hypothetical protein
MIECCFDFGSSRFRSSPSDDRKFCCLYLEQPIGTLDKLKKKDQGEEEDERDARLYVGGTVITAYTMLS